MKIEYLPNSGFILNAQKIEWGNRRDFVRTTLKNKHIVDDRVIDLSEIYDGDETKNIIQKRDLYSFGIFKKSNLALSYDNNQKLKEIEIHSNVTIRIDDITLKFGKDITYFINLLKNKQIKIVLIENGNYLLPELNMVIANSKSLGGNGNNLDYFYAASDISHLTK